MLAEHIRPDPLEILVDLLCRYRQQLEAHAARLSALRAARHGGLADGDGDHARLMQVMLEGLGGTADAVAGTLKETGIQGARNTARSRNPLVRYLQSHLRVDASLDMVQRDRLRLTFGNGSREEAVLPEAARQFMDGFDRGGYPELELPSPAAG